MTTSKIESATIKAARVQLRKRLKAVGRERDALRRLAEDSETLADSCDEAMDALRTAIEALSRYA